MNPLLLIGGVLLILGFIQVARENEEGNVPILPKPKKKKKAKPAPVSVVVQSPTRVEEVPTVLPVAPTPKVPTDKPTEE